MKRYIFTSDDGAILVSGSAESGQPGLISPDGVTFFEVDYQTDPVTEVEFLEHRGTWTSPAGYVREPQLLHQIGNKIWTYGREFTFRPEGATGLRGHDEIAIHRADGTVEGGSLASLVRIPQPVGA